MNAKVKIYLEIIPGAAAWATLVQKLNALPANQRNRVVLAYLHPDELDALKGLKAKFAAPVHVLKTGALIEILERTPETIVLPCLVNQKLTHDEFLVFQHTLDMLLKTASVTLETTLPMVAYDGVNDVLHPPIHWPHDAQVNSMMLRQYVTDYHVCDVPPQTLLGRYLAGELTWALAPDMLNIANLHRLREAMFSLVATHASEVARQLSLSGNTGATAPLSVWAYLPSRLGCSVLAILLVLAALASHSALLPLPQWGFWVVVGLVLIGLGAIHIRVIGQASQLAQENYNHALLRLIYDVSYLNDADEIVLCAMGTLRRGLSIHVVYGRLDGEHINLMDNVRLSEPDFNSMMDALQSGYVTAPPEEQIHGFIWCPVKAGQVTLGVLGVKHINGHSLYQTYALTEFLRTFTRLLAGAVWRVKLDQEKSEAAFLANRENLRSSLLSSVSHDLQTPLVSVIGGLSTVLMMEKTLPPKARRDLLMTAYTEAQRLQRIVQNVLAMAGMESGTMVLRKVLIDVPDMVQMTVARVKRAYPKLTIQIHDKLLGVQLYGDELLLSQVLYNLLENAAKYGPIKQKVLVNLMGNAGNNTLNIAVIDQGQGIPPADLEKVFDKHYRSSLADSKPAGSGLGLAICRAIVEAHGGTITAYARPDKPKGMVFAVTLPAGVAVESESTVINLEEEHPDERA